MGRGAGASLRCGHCVNACPPGTARCLCLAQVCLCLLLSLSNLSSPGGLCELELKDKLVFLYSKLGQHTHMKGVQKVCVYGKAMHGFQKSLQQNRPILWLLCLQTFWSPPVWYLEVIDKKEVYKEKQERLTYRS